MFSLITPDKYFWSDSSLVLGISELLLLIFTSHTLTIIYLSNLCNLFHFLVGNASENVG